jgi:hypothetical protein
MARVAKEGTMARNSSGHKNGQIQSFVKEQLEEAQRRFSAFEVDAEKTLKQLISRGKEQRKELEGLIHRLGANGEAIFENATVRQLSKRANQASSEVCKRLDTLQAHVVEAVGVASQAQVREINRELGKLSRKLDTLVGKRGQRPEASA